MLQIGEIVVLTFLITSGEPKLSIIFFEVIPIVLLHFHLVRICHQDLLALNIPLQCVCWVEWFCRLGSFRSFNSLNLLFNGSSKSESLSFSITFLHIFFVFHFEFDSKISSAENGCAQ